jgi:hypothetical protein
MLPPAIRRLLNRLRRRERLLDLAWAGARWLTAAAALFALACLVDFLIDRRRDTPYPLRVGLLAVQMVAWLAGLIALARALSRRRSDDELALRIEGKVPELGHRLISAVQLNRPGAKVQGMSPGLIAAVTRQAEEQAAAVDLGRVSDAPRLLRSVLLVTPVLLASALLAVAVPDTAEALVARLFLADREVPRSVMLASAGPEVWPAGEEGVLRIRVEGRVPGPETAGEVRLDPEDGPPLRLELRREEGEGAVWSARVPASDVPFTFRAWLADGRLRRPGQVRYEPRPAVRSLEAAVRLPVALLGRRPDGQPYEEPQRGGDVDFRLPGSRARLVVTAQTPLAGGEVRISGSRPRRVPLALASRPEQATAEFDLLPGDRGYAVVVRGRSGFENSDLPRRGIRRLPLEAPEVALLPETFWKPGDAGPPEDREIEGIPALLGGRFPLAYRCAARYGLSHAQLRYRVIPQGNKVDEDSGKINLDSFLPLPLGPARGSKGLLTARAREEFWTTPAARGGLPDTQGGGRYDFSTAGIPDGKGGLLDLREGDRIQFYVEVFGKAEPEGNPGRSAVREKEVVEMKAYLGWLRKKDDLKERVRRLEERQRAARPGGDGGDR